MGGKSDTPSAPDYGPLIQMMTLQSQAAQASSEKMTKFAEKVYADNKVVMDEVIDQSEGDFFRNSRNAARDRQRYEYIFQPLEEQLAYESEQYASPERQEYEAGKAQADISAQFDTARRTAQEKLETFGVDPSQTRSAALDLSTRVAQAAASSGASNQARERTANIGRALRSEAINVGKGYPGQIAGQYGTSQASGNQSVNVGLAGAQSGVSTMGSPIQWSGQSGQFGVNAANTMNMGFNNQLAASNAQNSQNSGWGQVAGQVAGAAFSALPFEEGGAIPGRHELRYADGGPAIEPPPAGNEIPPEASPSGGQQIDDVPYDVNDGGKAMLNVGEFVFPEDVARWFGEEKLQKMIEKARKDKANAAAQPDVAEEGEGEDPSLTQVPEGDEPPPDMPVMWAGGAIPSRYVS